MALSGMNHDFSGPGNNLYFCKANRGESSVGTSSWTIRNQSTDNQRYWLRSDGFTTGNKNVTKLQILIYDCSMVSQYEGTNQTFKAILGVSDVLYSTSTYINQIPDFKWKGETRKNLYSTTTDPYNGYEVTLDVDLKPNTTYYLYVSITSGGAWGCPNYHSSSRYTHLYAKYITSQDATYTISYNANGGSGAPSNQTAANGASFTVSSTRPTKANTTDRYKVTFNPNGGTCDTTDLTATRTTSYTFTSWNTAANNSGTTYNAGGTYTYSGSTNLTLYAQYSSSSTTSSIALPTATRTGYAFAGWSTSSNATSGLTGNYTPTGTTTLYAVWSRQSYNLYINLDGGTWNGSTADQIIPLNSGDMQTMPVPTKKGYIFGGWAWTTHGTMDKSQFACSVLSDEPAHGVQVYNNLGGSTVTHTYISGSNDKEKYDNDYIMIKTTGTAAPGLGGFRQTVMAEYNATYYHTFYAKLPVGYYFRAYNNTLPEGSTYQWLTNNEGTGQWQMYAYKLTTGSSGGWSTFGFIAVHPRGESPTTVTWYLGANQITKSPTLSQTFTAGEGNTWIYPLWIPQGTIHIWTGSFWASALPFIYTGTARGWVQAMPYVYTNNTDKWKLCGG